jgi:hypothetical protein
MRHLPVIFSLSLMLLTSVSGCTRVPVGAFGVSGSDAANGTATAADAGSNTREEFKLRRLGQIDTKIQQSADQLKAILDPSQSTSPANLDKLVVGDPLDPSLSYDRRFSAGQRIEQKMDQKAQELIDGTTTASSSATAVDTDNSLRNDRTLRNQAEIDKTLDSAATSASPETGTEPAESPDPALSAPAETKPTETPPSSAPASPAPSL